MRASSLFVVPVFAAFALYACVGDDPASGSSSSSGGVDASTTDDTGATSSSGGSSGTADTGTDVDPDPGPHGDTLAQLEIKSPAFGGDLAHAPGGGVIATWQHQGPALTIGAKTPDNNTGINNTYLMKFDANLSPVWWKTFVAGVQLAASPDGSVYWLAQMGEGGTPNSATIKTEVGTSETITIDGGGNNQGEEAGGAMIVVALNSDGSTRWKSVTSLASPEMFGAHFIQQEGTFAASDKVVLFTATVTGTLKYTDVNGNIATLACNNDYIVQRIDATNGRTRDLVKIAKSTAHQRIRAVAGTTGANGNGFVGLSEDWPANGSTFTKRFIAQLDATNGGAVPSRGNPIETNISNSDGFGGSIYQNVFPIAYSSPSAALSFSTAGQTAQTFMPPAAGPNAMFFLFDNATPKVKAFGGIGGSGYDIARFVIDARNGDIYGGGHYRSSDLTVNGTMFPPAPDANTDMGFAVRMKVDTAQSKLVPVWARHFSGTARVNIDAAASDAITGDLYLSGWIAKGKTSFGMGDITAPTGGLESTRFLVKVRR
jgi:hypothetical protein